jgi:hypothetical protein
MPALEVALRWALLLSCVDYQRHLYQAVHSYSGAHGARVPRVNIRSQNFPDQDYLTRYLRRCWAFSAPQTRRFWGAAIAKEDFLATDELFACPGTSTDYNYQEWFADHDVQDWVNPTSGNAMVTGNFMMSTKHMYRAGMQGEWPSPIWGGNPIESTHMAGNTCRWSQVYKYRSVMIVESVGAFCRPQANRISSMHGGEPGSGDSSMNITFSDGAIQGWVRWDDQAEWGSTYYYPNNDRDEWGFWRNVASRMSDHHFFH